MADSQRICSVDGCGKRHYGHGLCENHLNRMKRHGDPLAGGTARGAPMAFLEAALNADHDECVIWPYALNSDGYGILRVDGLTRNSPRLVCERAHGAPPSTKHEAAHSCGNRACINHSHLRWATHTENSADKEIHGTVQRGENATVAKLTDADVRAIRSSSETFRRLADRYGVGETAISNIKSGRRWSHVD